MFYVAIFYLVSLAIFTTALGLTRKGATMKVLVVAAVLLSSSVAHALEYDSPYTSMIFSEMGVKVTDCVKASEIGMSIVKKIAPDKYEAVFIVGNEGVVSRALLKTVKTEFSGTGLINIYVRYWGVQNVTLENGFSAKYGTWKECTVFGKDVK